VTGSSIAFGCEDGKVVVFDEPDDSGLVKKAAFAAHDSAECLRVCFDEKEKERMIYCADSSGKVVAWRNDLQEGWKQELQASCARVGYDNQIYSLFQFDSCIGAAHDNKITIFEKGTMTEILSWGFLQRGTASIGGSRNPGNEVFVFDTVNSDSQVFSALSDGTLRLRDARAPFNDAQCAQVHEEHVTCCERLADSNLIACGSGAGVLAVLDTRTWRIISRKNSPDRSPLYGLMSFSQESFIVWNGDGLLQMFSIQKVPVIISKTLNYPIMSAALGDHFFVFCGGSTPEHEDHHLGKENVAIGIITKQHLSS